MKAVARMHAIMIAARFTQIPRMRFGMRLSQYPKLSAPGTNFTLGIVHNIKAGFQHECQCHRFFGLSLQAVITL
jgi:hypothetical protein